MFTISIFGTGVILAGIIDFCIQKLFKKFGGKHLKRNHAYHLFLDINLFVPIMGGVLALLVYGSHVSLKIFAVSAVFGTFFEFLLGQLLFMLHGRPVWEYQYLPLGRFTSWLSIAYWGGAGLLFVRIASWFS